METHRQENSSLNDDAYTAVFGKEHSGRVRGVGFGVVPSQYFGSSSGARAPSSSSGGNGEIIAMRQELDESKARVRDLEEKFAMLAQQFSLYTRGNEVMNLKYNDLKCIHPVLGNLFFRQFFYELKIRKTEFRWILSCTN